MEQNTTYNKLNIGLQSTVSFKVHLNTVEALMQKVNHDLTH